LTNAQKAHIEKVNNVLLQGFAKIEDIEAAMIEQHKDLPEDEKENIKQQLEEF
jgi:hypothetical protein